MTALERLAEVKAKNIQRFDWRTIFKSGADTLSADDAQKLDSYFSHFAALTEGEDLPCIQCGAPLGGFLGTFEWGLAHGEGNCSRCQYPGRALHYNVGPIKRIEVILQYHPDDIEVPE